MGLKFTIIIPVRISGDEKVIQNKVAYFKECYYSCLNQTYDDIEIIIADNDSASDVMLALARYADSQEHTKFVTSEFLYPYSWYEPVHAAWDVMSGDYFTIVAYDDLLEDDYISNLAKILSKTNLLALQSPIRSIDQNGRKKLEPDVKFAYKSLDEFKQQYMTRCPVTTPSVVYRSDLVADGKLESDPGTYFGYDDYFMYGSMADQAIMIAPFPKWLGYYYRWHPEQATNGMKRDYPNLDQKIQEYWRNKWNE